MVETIWGQIKFGDRKLFHAEWPFATLLPLGSFPLPVKADIIFDHAQVRSNVMGGAAKLRIHGSAAHPRLIRSLDLFPRAGRGDCRL